MLRPPPARSLRAGRRGRLFAPRRAPNPAPRRGNDRSPSPRRRRDPRRSPPRRAAGAGERSPDRGSRRARREPERSPARRASRRHRRSTRFSASSGKPAAAARIRSAISCRSAGLRPTTGSSASSRPDPRGESMVRPSFASRKCGRARRSSSPSTRYMAARSCASAKAGSIAVARSKRSVPPIMASRAYCWPRR